MRGDISECVINLAMEDKFHNSAKLLLVIIGNISNRLAEYAGDVMVSRRKIVGPE